MASVLLVVGGLKVLESVFREKRRFGRVGDFGIGHSRLARRELPTAEVVGQEYCRRRWICGPRWRGQHQADREYAQERPWLSHRHLDYRPQRKVSRWRRVRKAGLHSVPNFVIPSIARNPFTTYAFSVWQRFLAMLGMTKLGGTAAVGALPDPRG